MNVAPSCYLGESVSDRVVLLARVPEDAPEGLRVRALHLCVAEDLVASQEHFWVLSLGRIFNGKFDKLSKEIGLTGRQPGNTVVRYTLLDPALVSRSTILALRITPRGTPPPLAGASVVVEWGTYASRRSGNG